MSKIFLTLFFFLFTTLAQAQTEPLPSGPQQVQIQDQSHADMTDSMPTYKGAFVKMMVTLLGLIALIVISVWMLRRIAHGRMKQMNYGREIKVIERRPLSAKSVLYLIEVGGKKVVVAESQVEVRAITGADHLPLED